MTIEGMTCDSCIFTITKALSSKPGVSKVHIDLQSKLASIVYDSRLTASDFIIEHIHGLNEGFTASEAHSQAQIFHVQGLNCGNCVKKIEGSLDNVTVNLPQAKAYCLKNPKEARPTTTDDDRRRPTTTDDDRRRPTTTDDDR